MQCMALLMDQLDALDPADVGTTAEAICACLQHSLAMAMLRDAAASLRARACEALTRASELLATPTFAEWGGMRTLCAPTLWAVLEAVRLSGIDSSSPLAVKVALLHALLALLALTTRPPPAFVVTLDASAGSGPTAVAAQPLPGTAADVAQACAAVSVCASMSVVDESGSDGAADRSSSNQQVHLQVLSRLPAVLGSLVAQGMCTVDDGAVSADNVARAISGQ